MSNRIQKFVKRYNVTLVSVSGIIGIHYGWYLMQKNPSLVTEEERIDLPVVTFAKYWVKSLKQQFGFSAPPLNDELPTVKINNEVGSQQKN